MIYSTTKLDWNTDVEKHYVRRQAWLPAAMEQVEASRAAGRDPNYLTFCAAEAIDVFLFLREGVIQRDPLTDVVVDTYFCEKKDEQFNRISQLLGAHDQGFLGDFVDMILFEDDEETRNADLSDPSRRYSRDLRKRLATKERHQRFRAALPFDMMNLDICGTFFPPQGGVQSPMLRSIKTLLDWQTQCAENDDEFESFTLFLTAHVEGGKQNEDAMNELVTMMENNAATYAGFARAMHDRLGTSDSTQAVEEAFEDFYCVALPKVIVGEAFDRGWLADVRFSGRYRREKTTNLGTPGGTYHMLVWVGRFDRHRRRSQPLGRTQTPSDHDYAESILGLTCQPEDINERAVGIQEEISRDLKSVVASREEYQAAIREGASRIAPMAEDG